MFFNIFKNLKGFVATKQINSHTKARITHEWRAINEMLDKGTPTHLRQAVIMADKTLDNALKDLVKGTTMGERLKNARDLFDKKTYNQIWDAHKIRNALVHDSGYEPTHFMLRGAVENLQNALKNLNIRF